MHWNVAPDALPGSATFVRVLDRWLNDCILSLSVEQKWLYPPASASIVSSTPVLLRSPKQKVSQAGDLITPMLAHPEYAIVKTDEQSKVSSDDAVNIIVLGWEGGVHYSLVEGSLVATRVTEWNYGTASLTRCILYGRLVTLIENHL